MRSESFYNDVPLRLRLNEPCGRILCGAGWERTRENSLNLRDWELWLVWRGSGWMQTAAGRHPLFAGFCALMRPGGIYDAGHDESDPLGITFIHFDLLRGSHSATAAKRAVAASREQGLDAQAAPAKLAAPHANRSKPATGGQTPVETEIRPLLIDADESQWPEFFLLDDIEYADLLTSRLLGLLYNNLPAATALLHAFIADLLEREPIAAQAWEQRTQTDAGQGRAAAAPPGRTPASLRDVPHYRELRQLFARLRTTSPEALPTVAQMASQIGLSAEHFSRLFRRVNGQSPMRLIVSLRITHARHLLRESSLSVSEIADALGYTDVYFFSRQFKEQTGVSPLAYRRHG